MSRAHRTQCTTSIADPKTVTEEADQPDQPEQTAKTNGVRFNIDEEPMEEGDGWRESGIALHASQREVHEPPAKKGLIDKKGQVRTNWKKRFFILHKGT
jgi:hypothetical protein